MPRKTTIWMCFQLLCRQSASRQQRPLPLQGRSSRRRRRWWCCRRRTRSRCQSRRLLQGSLLHSPLRSSRRHSSRWHWQQRQQHRPCHSGRQSALGSWSAGSVQQPQQVQPSALRPWDLPLYMLRTPLLWGGPGRCTPAACPASCSGGTDPSHTSAKVGTCTEASVQTVLVPLHQHKSCACVLQPASRCRCWAATPAAPSCASRSCFRRTPWQRRRPAAAACALHVQVPAPCAWLFSESCLLCFASSGWAWVRVEWCWHELRQDICLVKHSRCCSCAQRHCC